MSKSPIHKVHVLVIRRHRTVIWPPSRWRITLILTAPYRRKQFSKTLSHASDQQHASSANAIYQKLLEHDVQHKDGS